MSVHTGTFQKEKTRCYHCGEVCDTVLVEFDHRSFCCDGCRLVYELLSENNLCSYYQFEEKSGIVPKVGQFHQRFAFLDDPGTVEKLVSYRDQERAIITFNLPQIHCSSCIWLLEHLYRLNPGINSSRTDFLKKELTIEYHPGKTSLRKIVELLTTIGYEPSLHLGDLDAKKNSFPQRKRIYRIAIAGFCFANIMMLSFPEYFHIGEGSEASMQKVFSYLILALSLPVLAYSGGEFFESAWAGIRGRFLNIDVPLALSIGVTFGRSLYEIFTGTGPGYLDSMSGIIFFMLIGRYFQERTSSSLQFDRNFKSYFPIAVTIPSENGDTTIPLSQLKSGQRILVRSQELIPADARLIRGDAWIDYSFVTGESEPVHIREGELIYAGGKQTRGIIELVTEKDVAQGYLVSLWNRQTFKQEKTSPSFIHGLAKYFTLGLIALALGAFFYWLPSDPTRGLDALTTVLIVACPCALLLSATFTNGAMIRIFSRNGLYLKHPGVIETLSKTTDVVFDKTGTITMENEKRCQFHGEHLSEFQLSIIYSAIRQSNHPLSRGIASQLSFCTVHEVEHYNEIPGLGVEAMVSGHALKVGSPAFVGSAVGKHDGSLVYVSMDDRPLGYFSIGNTYRPELSSVLHSIQSEGLNYGLLSGDQDGEKERLAAIFGENTPMKFNQSPAAKLEYIESLQQQSKKVLMVGDGLNDAGALRQSDAGIAVSNDVNNFSPACDGILEGKSFVLLPRFISLAKKAQRIIVASFVISLVYNTVGLSFAVRGELAPVIAAILMPLSSLTIIGFTTGASKVAARSAGIS